jgi:sugar O-acyltransferase (sialic acid O-acetyltransferase NeuD family)
MINPVVILGAGNIGKLALEIFQSNSMVVYCLLDDDKALHNTTVNEVPVLGATDDDNFLKLLGDKCDAFVATDDTRLKKHQVEMLRDRKSVMPVNCFHKTSYISPSAEVGHGNLLSASSVVNAEAKLGNHNILHTGSVIDYNSEVGNYVQIGAGAIVNTGVTVGDEVFIGSGAIIVSGVTIGKKARIGAGSVVIEDVKDNTTVFGNPAKKV